MEIDNVTGPNPEESSRTMYECEWYAEVLIKRTEWMSNAMGDSIEDQHLTEVEALLNQLERLGYTARITDTGFK